MQRWFHFYCSNSACHKHFVPPATGKPHTERGERRGERGMRGERAKAKVKTKYSSRFVTFLFSQNLRGVARAGKHEKTSQFVFQFCCQFFDGLPRLLSIYKNRNEVILEVLSFYADISYEVFPFPATTSCLAIVRVLVNIYIYIYILYSLDKRFAWKEHALTGLTSYV